MYLKSADNRPDDHCWWCDPGDISGTQQTRDHLFKDCSRWKGQQAELWARVKEATERAKRKWRVITVFTMLLLSGGRGGRGCCH